MFLKFIFAMFLGFLPGIVGLIFAPIETGQNAWYSTLVSSSLTPDGWMFSMMWAVLYFFMGIALFMIMQTTDHSNRHDKTSAYTLFTINILLNMLWTYSFFGLHLPEAALIVLTALIIVVLFMAKAYLRISKGAFWLTVPYLLWLMFAFYLNGMIIYLN